LIIRSPGGESSQNICQTIRDVLIDVVPVDHDKNRGRNAICVFRVDDICIAHLGDLGHVLTPAQLKLMGKIDINYYWLAIDSGATKP